MYVVEGMSAQQFPVSIAHHLEELMVDKDELPVLADEKAYGGAHLQNGEQFVHMLLFAFDLCDPSAQGFIFLLQLLYGAVCTL